MLNRQIWKALIKINLLVAVVGVSGCSPQKLDSLVMDEQVTHDKLKLGNILFADAVMDQNGLKSRRETESSEGNTKNGKDDISEIESRRVAEIMIETLKSDREEIKTELATTHPKMTPEMAKSLLESMKSGRDIPPELMAKLSEKMLEFPRPYRFLAQVRIEGERFSKQRREHTETREEPTGRKNAQGQSIMKSVRYYFDDYISSRSMDLRMLIFDLKQKKIIYDGVAVESSSNSNRKERPAGRIIIVAGSNDSANDFPEFPDRLNLIKSGAIRFVGALPKP